DVEFRGGKLEFTRRRPELDVEGAHRVVFAQPEALHRTVSHVQQRRQVRVVAISQELSVARDQVDEPPECHLNVIQAAEYIGVIKFQVVNDGHLGQVMDKLAALVEEGRVIFVALEDEPVAVRKSGALSQVIRDAPNQVAWLESIVLKYPGEQR